MPYAVCRMMYDVSRMKYVVHTCKMMNSLESFTYNQNVLYYVKDAYASPVEDPR